MTQHSLPGSRPMKPDSRRKSRSSAMSSPSPGLLVTGLLVVGLGALAWYTMGPDLRRYMKIRSM